MLISTASVEKLKKYINGRSCAILGLGVSNLPLAETIRKFRHDNGLISLDIEGEDPDFYDDIQEKEAEHE